jgi:hypothetical protein
MQSHTASIWGIMKRLLAPMKLMRQAINNRRTAVATVVNTVLFLPMYCVFASAGITALKPCPSPIPPLFYTPAWHRLSGLSG